MDLVFGGIAVGFFALTWGFLKLCQKVGGVK